jgi:hypothetical protein
MTPELAQKLFEREIEHRESQAWRSVRRYASVLAASRTPQDREFNIKLLLREFDSQSKQIDRFIDAYSEE